MAQLVGTFFCAHRKFVGPIPGWGMYERQLIGDSLSQNQWKHVFVRIKKKKKLGMVKQGRA